MLDLSPTHARVSYSTNTWAQDLPRVSSRSCSRESSWCPDYPRGTPDGEEEGRGESMDDVIRSAKEVREEERN